MPPRYAYWTIILDGAPTSFRTKEREEILPLFNQLSAKNPGALLKWFSGGKIWDSPDQAREARAVEKVRAFREQRSQQVKAEREGGEDPLAEFRLQHGRPADGSDDRSLRQAPPWSPGSFPRQDSEQADPGAPEAPQGDRPFRPAAPRADRPSERRPDRRSKDWRPGGEHKDPRDKYKLPPGEARKRWKDRNLPSTRGGDDRSLRAGGPKPFGSKPSGVGGPRRFDERPEGERAFKPKPFGDRPRGPKPFGSKPGGDRPWGDRPRGPKPFGSKPGGDRPWGDRPRGPKPFGSKPSGVGGPRPFSGRPKGPGGPRPFRGKPGKPGGPRGKR